MSIPSLSSSSPQIILQKSIKTHPQLTASLTLEQQLTAIKAFIQIKNKTVSQKIPLPIIAEGIDLKKIPLSKIRTVLSQFSLRLQNGNCYLFIPLQGGGSGYPGCCRPKKPTNSSYQTIPDPQFDIPLPQTEASQLAGLLRRAAETGDQTTLLDTIVSLRDIAWTEVSDPLPIVQDLIFFLTSNKTDNIYGALKVEVAKLIEICCHQLFHKNKLRKETRQQLIDQLDQAQEHAFKDPLFNNPLTFHLKCARAALNLGNDFGIQWKSCAKGAATILLAILNKNTKGLTETLKQLSHFFHASIKKTYQSLWYTEVLKIYIHLIFALETEQIGYLQKIGDLLTAMKKQRRKVWKNDWKIAYACLNSCYQIIKETNQFPLKKEAFSIIKKTCDFNAFYLFRNWRVREQVIRLCITLAANPSFPKIQKNAQMVITERQEKEKDARVLMIINNPLHVTALNDHIEASLENDRKAKQTKKTLIDLMSQLDSFLQTLRAEPSFLIASIKKNALSKKKDIDAIRATYIPAKVSFSHLAKSGRSLETTLNQFLNDPKKKVLAVLGNPGSGKSILTKLLEYDLWKKDDPSDPELVYSQTSQIYGHDDEKKEESPEPSLYTTFAKNKWIPLHIELPSLINPEKDAIGEAFERLGIAREKIVGLKKEPFFFILDSYDELNKYLNLYASNRFYEWENSKVLITSRYEYFKNDEQLNKLLCPRNHQRKVLSNQISKLFLDPFNETEITTYLQKHIHVETKRFQRKSREALEWTTADQYLKAISEIQGKNWHLKDLVTNPFWLWVTSHILPQVYNEYTTDLKNNPTNPQITIDERYLYDKFVDKWFDREEEKLLAQGKEANKQDFKDFCIALAKDMYKANVLRIQYHGEKNSPWHLFLNPKDKQKRQILHACPIVKTAPATWAFIHQGFYDYFVAS
ncbi:MAG: hypothetical protein AAF443_00425 [Chlamydiota bacterium]